MGKKLKIIIVFVIGVVVVLFIGVAFVLSFVAPGAVLEADSNNNITGVTQFFVLKDGSLYHIRFSLVNKDGVCCPKRRKRNFYS